MSCFATDRRAEARSTRTWRWQVGIVVLCAATAVVAQQDGAAAGAQRRMQQQMQRLQQQVQDLQSAKTLAEAAKATAEQGLRERDEALATEKVQARRAKDGLVAGQATQAALGRRVAELEKQLADQTQAREAQATELERLRAQSTQQLAAKERERLVQVRLNEEAARQNLSCSTRNIRLVALSTTLAERYRRKGVWESLRQSDPLVGLRDVDVFNEVQALRDQIDAERYLPADAPGRSP